ncbi:hypothetical protein L9F63_006260 [Diploptera punctata]|uniref:Serpin domain-containing protein n=1 Tax=Diploptera punctata TaxID=6984 RepID=A0AAD8E4N8_DIPPU|nr:hypothetical protein L9F63_006260 [Diploptera punctata]
MNFYKDADSNIIGGSRSYTVADPINSFLTDAINQFSSKLMQNVMDSPISTNNVISPISAYVLLSIVQQGADGATKKNLEKILHVEASDALLDFKNLVVGISERGDYGLQVEFATSAFYSEVFDGFMRDIGTNYDCEAYPTDQLSTKLAVQAMDKWISINYKMNTTQFVLQGSCNEENVVLAICSALYFRCEWQEPCHCQKARKMKFNVRPLKFIKVPSFHYEALCKAGTSQDFQWVHLNLEKGMFSLVLVLPIQQYALDDVIKEITPEVMTNIIREKEIKHAKLTVPQFTLKQKTNLKPALLKLGLRDMYGGLDDFKGISCKRMKLMSSVQDMKITVNIRGVSIDSIKGKEETTLPPEYELETLELVFNYPFLVFLVDLKNSVPLLIGRVKKPKYEQPRCVML